MDRHARHLFNILVRNTARLVRLLGRMGVPGFIRFLQETCNGPRLDAAAPSPANRHMKNRARSGTPPCRPFE